MRTFLAWLLGIPPETLGPETEIEYRLNQAPEGWLVFLLALGVIVFTVWIYRRDGRQTASGPFRFLLGVLRASLIALALLILTEPVLLATHTEKKPSTVVLMVDDSFSMGLGFPYAEKRLRQQVQNALGPGYEVSVTGEDGATRKVPIEKLDLRHYGQITRMQVACQALRKDHILESLKKRHQVKLYTFSKTLTTADEDNHPLVLSADRDFEPRGPETRIGESLRQALKELRGLPLAGVVLVSDGRQNAGEDAVRVAASQYRVQRIPLFTVSVGDPSAPKDIELSIEGPDVILPDDPSEVIAYVRQKGYHSLGPLRIEMKSGDRVVSSQELKLGKPGVKVPVPLKFREAKPGKYSYTIKIPVQDGELRKENNAATYNFRVVDKKVKVLFVEGQDRPRWEYRYLKNALLRDHTTEADILLATSDGAFLWEGSPGQEPLETFPVNKKEINAYDVIILGDLNPVIFTSEQMKLLREFVREGGGFIMIAGERFAPSSYLSGPLSEMLPVVPQRAGFVTPGEGIQEAFPVELTAAGKRLAWTHLDPDESANREIWDRLPKLFWYYPVKKVKALATAIAVHPFDKDEQGKKMPLVAIMPYGSGRTMFIGVDSLWRWRMGVGDRYHYRFYNQAIRYLSMAKRLGGQKRFLLGVDKVSYAIGDKVILTGILKDEKFNPLTAEHVTVFLKTPKGETQTVELNRLHDRPGSYEGYFFPSKQGDYTMWLKDNAQPEARQSELSFKVDEPQLELENPRMNEEMLKAIAAAGGDGGRYVTIDRLGEVPPLIQPKEEKVLREIPLNLWDNWIVLAVFALLITLEWVLRKRGRMI